MLTASDPGDQLHRYTLVRISVGTGPQTASRSRPERRKLTARWQPACQFCSGAKRETLPLSLKMTKTGAVAVALPALRLFMLIFVPAAVFVNYSTFSAPGEAPRLQANLPNDVYLSSVLLPQRAAVQDFRRVVPSTRPTASPSPPLIPRTMMQEAVVPAGLKRGSKDGCKFKQCKAKHGPYLYILTVRRRVWVTRLECTPGRQCARCHVPCM